MFKDLLTTVGESLFGEYWRKPLAEALGVNLRTLERWASGTFEPAEGSAQGLLADMRKLVVARGRELDRVVAAIDKARG